MNESEMKARIEILERNLRKCKEDYWFMINLIENYGGKTEQTMTDVLERMKFRQGLFNVLGDE